MVSLKMLLHKGMSGGVREEVTFVARKRKESRGAVVVTGASTGIGEVCALYLDKLGFKVFAGVRKKIDSDNLKNKASGRLDTIFIDITDAESIASAKESVAANVEGAGLAGLVNNAGIEVGGLLEFLPISEIRRQLEVNVIGTIAVTQAFLPLVRKGHGRIVNIGSITGRMPLPYLGPYSASKAAMEAITDSLRMELRPWRIPVSIIEPSTIKTPMWDKAREAAHETVKDFPQAAHDLYGPAIKAMIGLLEDPDKIARVATPASAVARAVVHAITARRPKARYPVGWDSKIGVLFTKFVPAKTRDWMIMLIWRRLGLKGEV
jgi:NAD(P)-dependent dehydrogenase (short-subunit alcohol dehydrogenase family)